jgi:proline iminopeptidase
MTSALVVPACLDPGDPGNLVPPTVDEDPALPRLDVTVAGHTRGLHLERFGDPAAPPLLFLHGTYSDYRHLRPLALALSDRYHVIVWDQRGAGLSERITREEFTLDAAVEEIDAVREALVPGEPVTLFGHSWGGGLAAMYAGRHPDEVEQMVLAEPMPLDQELMTEQAQEILDLDYLNPVWNDTGRMGAWLPLDEHAALDARAELVLESGMTRYFCDPEHPTPIPRWRVGGYLEWARNQVLLDGPRWTYDFTIGLEDYEEPVLILGGSCGALGAAFQREQASRFPSVAVVEIEDAGHRLTVERPSAVLQAARAYLYEYVEEEP